MFHNSFAYALIAESGRAFCTIIGVKAGGGASIKSGTFGGPMTALIALPAAERS